MRRSVTGTVSLAAMAIAVATSADGDMSPRSLALRQALPASVADSMGRETGTVSANGRFVAFASRSSLLPADTNGLDDIYVLDRLQSTLTLETRASDGSGSNGSSRHPRLSGDGARLVFASSAVKSHGESGGLFSPIPSPGRTVAGLRQRSSGGVDAVVVRDHRSRHRRHQRSSGDQ